jgi:hypothetical protein
MHAEFEFEKPGMLYILEDISRKGGSSFSREEPVVNQT